MAKNIKKLFALILAISMVMSLSVNAVTIGLEAVCGKTAHTHTYDCFAPVCGKTEAVLDLICEKDEHVCTDTCHVHSGDCYAECDKLYDCTDTTEGHEHGEDCAHKCTDACKVLTCDVVLCVPHMHGEDCYAPHAHVEGCYDDSTDLVCELEDHTHIDSCNTVWYGDDLKVDVEAGTDGYTFMALFRKPAHGYEFGGHFMGDGEGPQTFVVIDTAKYDGKTWTPDGLYEFGESNYEVVYCCDVETIIKDGTYYKRMNLEDSEYYDVEEAAKIRAIVTNAYPYVSVEQMRKNLAKDGFAYAEELTRNEIITAVQCAIWASANDVGAEDLRYAKSYNVGDNLQWGYPLHDTSNESGLAVAGKRVFEVYPEVGTRIDALVDYLLDQTEAYPSKNQVVITGMNIVDSQPIQAKEGVYTIALRVQLNNSGSSKNRDDLSIKIYVDGVKAKTVAVEYGTETYDLTVEASANSTIKAVVEGTQILPEGVYFYAPKPADVDPDNDGPELPDGIATAREVSQNLVGVAAGKTEVYAESKEIKLELDEETPVTGTLQLQKTDENGKILSGAEFALYVVGETSTMYVDTYAVDENGQLTVEGLLPGDYELEETVVPEGYLDPDGVFTFSIDAEGTLVGDDVADGVMIVVNEQPKYTVTYEYIGSIQPENPSELPATESYPCGKIVTVAEDATAEGYVFSGWSETGTFEMPAEDVVITGSWDVASTPMAPKFAYEVRYFLEELDGSYEEVTADFYRAFDELGATVSPAEKAYEHYVLNTELSDAQGTVIAPSVVNGELNILRMNVYFDREEYTVTYKYTGSVQPEDPSELPATETYKYGETVTVAEDATAEGYVFSGWSKTGTFEMPAEDVVITGSWKVAASQFVPKFAYEVRYFQEQRDGSYEEVTADFYRAFDELGATVSPAEKAYEHYVLNTELSDAQGTVIAPSVVDGELNILRMNVYFDLVRYTVTYIDRGEVVQFTEELVSGDEIPDCEDPETYFDKHHKYNFQNWILVEGEEGEDSTIGTTNLVYESVYKRSNKPNPTPPSDSDDDPDVEILDDEVPLAEIPALFGDDHYAYIIGYTDGLVHPEANITRAEVATIFFRLLDEEIRNTLMTDINDFPDVEKGQWYNHAVSTLSSMGIVLGRNDGNFYPNDFITRAEFAAIAARFDPSGNPEGVFFSDIAGHWAEREIIIAANNGWVEGYNGLFRPDDYITRAEAMTLVNRVLHRLPETEHDLLEYMVIWPDNMNVDAWYYLAVQEATNSHDYIRKTDPIYESWTEFIEPYDWSLLEY